MDSIHLLILTVVGVFSATMPNGDSKLCSYVITPVLWAATVGFALLFLAKELAN